MTQSKTGCELIWNQGNQGCYLHTREIARGNGVGNHYCWVHDFAPGMAVKLKGEIGDELVKITSGTFAKKIGPIPKTGMTVNVPEPKSGKKFTIEFLNDNGVRDVFFLNKGWDITHPENWDGWACGSSSPNERCEKVKNGELAWRGVYKLKRK